MTEYREDCYFYHESQEMGAHVPNCVYDEKYEYGFCPCNNNCKNYITKKEAYKLIKKIVLCKDCISRNGSECQNDDLLRQIHDCGCGATFHTDDDWFCPYGEREGSEQG